MSKQSARKALRSLAAAAQVNQKPERGGGYTSRTIPAEIAAAADPPLTNHASLELDPAAARRYWAAFRELRELDEAEHLSDRELDDALWALTCELAILASLRATDERGQRVSGFVDELLSPWEEYDAVVQIRGLLLESPVSIGEVQLIRPGPMLLRSWDLWDPDWVRPRWRGHMVASLRVRGGAPAPAAARARQIVQRVSDELKEAFQATIHARLDDDQLAFREGWWAVRRAASADRKVTAALWVVGSRWQRVSNQTWSEDHTRRALEYLSPLYELRNSDRAQLVSRVDTALSWLGVARTIEPVSAKVLALCSALEALLVERGDRRKAEPLAIRDMLLGSAVDGGFVDPGPLFSLYRDVRSELAHGETAAARDDHYWTLLSRASGSLWRYVAFANQQPGAKRHVQLLRDLADPDALRMHRHWLERARPYGHSEMCAVLDRWLEKA